MNLEQVKEEIKGVGKSPVSEKMYPITSDWVPIPDVLAIINRFEKHWKQYREMLRTQDERKLMSEVLGQ